MLIKLEVYHFLIEDSFISPSVLVKNPHLIWIFNLLGFLGYGLPLFPGIKGVLPLFVHVEANVACNGIVLESALVFKLGGGIVFEVDGVRGGGIVFKLDGVEGDGKVFKLDGVGCGSIMFEPDGVAMGGGMLLDGAS
ncbi:hypothetical protein Tco_0509514 [Tanacetum coccineum]